MLTRHEFLKLGAVAGASLFLPIQWNSNAPSGVGFYNSQPLKKFA